MSSRIRRWWSWVVVSLIFLAALGKPAGNAFAQDSKDDTVDGIAKCHPNLAALGIDWIADPEAPIIARAFNKLWDHQDADCREKALVTLVREVRRKRTAVQARPATCERLPWVVTQVRQ